MRPLFVGGLHRSGTSVLARCLGRHPEIGGLRGTGVPEDEGQHLQDVYPTAKSHGGPGRFGFDPGAHLTELSPLASPDNRERLLECWAPYWDGDRAVLVEKSPPNLIRTRFLQALFPEAAFLIVVRHPAAVTEATAKWRRLTTRRRLVEHWLRCHELLAGDLPHLHRARVIRYEHLVEDPRRVLAGVLAFLGLPGPPEPAEIRTGSNARYFEAWESGVRPARSRWVSELEPRVALFGYSLVDLERVAPSPLLGESGKVPAASSWSPPVAPPRPRPGA